MRRILPTAIAFAAFAAFFEAGGVSPAEAQGRYVPCAREGGYCRVPYPTEVFYGAGRRGTSRSVDGRGVPCSNDFFGDPAPNVPKSCAYLDRGGGYDRGDRMDRRRGDWDDRPRRRRIIEEDDY